MRVHFLNSYTLADLAELSRTTEPILPVRYDGGLALLGPVIGAGPGVCLECAEHARLTRLGAPRDPRLRLGGRPTPASKPLLHELIQKITASPAEYLRTVVAVRTDLGTTSHHRVRSRPEGCPVCRPLPLDSPEHIVSLPIPVRPGSLREPNPLTDGDSLHAELFDLRHGPVVGVFHSGHLPLAVASAELVGDNAAPEAGFGRTVDFTDAERVALYEAVERFSSMRPRRATTATKASYAELGPDRALDPVRLGRYDPEHVAHSAFHLRPYSPDAQTRWVFGWSYTERKPIAVPEHVAYWATNDPSQFIAETSNGCGLGNNLTEAVLHGLFEVAERDAFLMAWYAKTPLRPIRLPADPVLPHLADRLESLGYTLMFFDATNDLGIPAVISVAKYLGENMDTPMIYYAAGAHPDPRRAMLSAAAEVAVDVEAAADRVAAAPELYSRRRLLRLLAEPESIRTMHEHVAVNGLPEAADRHEFLVDGGLPEIEIEDLASVPHLADLRLMLDYFVGHLRQLGLEIIAVDQTDPATSNELGLHSAKVIVPGTLPMTFGHLYRRTLGLPRLLEVPHQLRRVPAVPPYTALSLQPHPFP
ncbi:MAG: TOMM precursor leader peptide-binding protein [Kibdelosporangium sp.]